MSEVTKFEHLVRGESCKALCSACRNASNLWELEVVPRPDTATGDCELVRSKKPLSKTEHRLLTCFVSGFMAGWDSKSLSRVILSPTKS